MDELNAKKICDLSPCGIVHFGKDGAADYINPSFSEITSIPPEDISGVGFETVIAQLNGLSIEEASVDSGRMNTSGCELLINAETSQLRNIRYHIRDTETQEKILYVEELSAAMPDENDQRLKFISAAEHKLRTPLVTIIGFGELLSTHMLDTDKQSELIEAVYKQSLNLQNFIDSYLGYERLSVKKRSDFAFEKTTLKNILDSIVEAESDNERIKYQPADIWPVLEVEIDKITQAISILISNAKKYSPEESEIICTTRVHSAGTENYFEITVTDYGMGISTEDLPRVGQPFFRTDDAHSIPGSGLGLAIANKIFAAHNGQLIIDSIRNKGTTVYARLPVNR